MLSLSLSLFSTWKCYSVLLGFRDKMYTKLVFYINIIIVFRVMNKIFSHFQAFTHVSQVLKNISCWRVYWHSFYEFVRLWKNTESKMLFVTNGSWMRWNFLRLFVRERVLVRSRLRTKVWAQLKRERERERLIVRFHKKHKQFSRKRNL